MKTLEKALVELSARSGESHAWPVAAMTVTVRIEANSEPRWHVAIVPTTEIEGFAYPESSASLDRAIAIAVERELEERRRVIEALEARLAALIERTPKVTAGVAALTTIVPRRKRRRHKRSK